MPERHHTRGPALLCVLAGGLVAALGLVVLYGWYAHDLRLLHVLPAFVAMAYNTALAFFLGGTALLLAGLDKPRPAAVAAAAALLIGLLSLSEYLLGLSLGIDELFMPAYTRAGIVNSARMSLSTSLCFSLAASALLFALTPRLRPWCAPAMALLACVVVGLGTVALSGYATGVIRSYAWGQLTRMAVHTAVGFLVLGGGVLALAWARERAAGGDVTRWLPLVIGLSAATATLCVWQALVVEQSAQADLIRRLEAANTRLPLWSLSRAESLIPDGALVGGLTLASLLAVAAHLAQTARARAREAEAANGALRVAQEGLEVRVAERTAELALANRAVRDVLLSVTEGKFHLCESETDLPPPADLRHDVIPLSRAEGLRGLRHCARQAAGDGGLLGTRLQDLETAVGEAAMNAVVHGGGGRGQVCVSAYGDVQVWVWDDGQGITMEHLPRATLERGYTTAGTLGHGFWLMLNMVDRLWLLTGPTGTAVVLEQKAVPPEPNWLAMRPTKS